MSFPRIAVLCWLISLAFCSAEEQAAKVVQSVLHEDGSRTDTETDHEGHTQTVTNYNASGKMLQRTLYRLDQNNQPDAGIVYDPKNRVLYKMKYKRDATGRVVEQTDFTASDKFLRRLAFTYDGRGRLYQIDAYDEAGKLTGTSVGKERKSKRTQ